MGLAGRNAAGAAAGARGGRGAAGPGAPRSEAISEGAQAGAPPLPKVSISRCEAFGAIGGISLRPPKGPGPHPKRTPTQVESSGRKGGPPPTPGCDSRRPAPPPGKHRERRLGKRSPGPQPPKPEARKDTGVAPRAAAREEPGARTANDGFGSPRSRKFPRARARCAAASRGRPRTPGGCGAGDRRGRGDPSGGGTCSPARRR